MYTRTRSNPRCIETPGKIPPLPLPSIRFDRILRGVRFTRRRTASFPRKQDGVHKPTNGVKTPQTASSTGGDQTRDITVEPRRHPGGKLRSHPLSRQRQATTDISAHPRTPLATTVMSSGRGERSLERRQQPSECRPLLSPCTQESAPAPPRPLLPIGTHSNQQQTRPRVRLSKRAWRRGASLRPNPRG